MRIGLRQNSLAGTSEPTDLQAPSAPPRVPWKTVSVGLAAMWLATAILAAAAAGEESRPFPQFRILPFGGEKSVAGQLCLVNDGPAGRVDRRPSDYDMDIIIPRVGEVDPQAVKLVPPKGWETTVEVQASAFVFKLEPVGDSIRVEKGAQLCFEMRGVDLFNLPPIAVAVGGRDPSAVVSAEKTKRSSEKNRNE